MMEQKGNAGFGFEGFSVGEFESNSIFEGFRIQDVQNVLNFNLILSLKSDI